MTINHKNIKYVFGEDIVKFTKKSFFQEDDPNIKELLGKIFFILADNANVQQARSTFSFGINYTDEDLFNRMLALKRAKKRKDKNPNTKTASKPKSRLKVVKTSKLKKKEKNRNQNVKH